MSDDDVGQPDYGKAPVPKVTAATAAAALATVVVVLVSAITGKDAPTGLEGALATLLAFVAGYLTPPRGS